MLSKARRKLWTIRHLKKAGMGVDDVLKIFNVIVRSTLEYAVPTYHPMLNIDLRDRIESIQKRACRIIFGWNCNYDKLVEDGKVELLETRREKMTLNFAKKCISNDRFKHWFKEKTRSEYNLRTEDKYEELFARTERMKKSPLFYMRRALNAE